MLEARITITTVVQDEKTNGTVLFGVAERFDDAVNFRVPYDWETLDKEGFLEDLREKLAQDFDVPVYYVDIQADKLLRKMEEYHMMFKRAN